MNLKRLKRGVWVLKKGSVVVPGKSTEEVFNRAYKMEVITAEEWVRLNRMAKECVEPVMGGAA